MSPPPCPLPRPLPRVLAAMLAVALALAASDATAAPLTLLDRPGAVFTASAATPKMTFVVGSRSATYRRVAVDVDVTLGAFRTDLPPDGIARWDHLLFELARHDQPQSYLRFLMGCSARLEQGRGPRAFNYGRRSIGTGASSYIAWKQAFGWKANTRYHLHMTIDRVAKQQTLEITPAGAAKPALTIVGPIAYIQPAHLSGRFTLSLGGEDASWGLHVSPHGARFAHLRVTAVDNTPAGPDAGATSDAGSRDAGAPSDASARDAGVAVDGAAASTDGGGGRSDGAGTLHDSAPHGDASRDGAPDNATPSASGGCAVGGAGQRPGARPLLPTLLVTLALLALVPRRRW